MLDSASSEDCLTVNVWAPGRPTTPAPPVLVWIYGGGFTSGSNRELSYDGQALAEMTGAVVVNMNYRLGPFGALALSALESEDPAHPSTGGYGLEDQRAALQWVQKNIAAFGGDPNRVMLFGESAGGISTCMHVVSPQSKGLFQSAVVESGPCDSATTKTKALAQGGQFATALGCDAAPDVLACLRGKTAAEVQTALPASSDLIFGDGATWFPVLDGWNLPDKPSVLLEAGDFNKVPVIFGSNADEATIFFYLAKTKIADDAAFQVFAEKLVPGHGQEVAARYSSAKFGTAQDAALAAVGHAGFVCPTRRAVRAIAKAGTPAYQYHFTYVPPAGLLGDLGAFHSAEIKFVFGIPSQTLPQPLTDDEIKLSNAIMGYWSGLAAKGDPNGSDALVWPKYDAAKDESLILDLKLSTQAGVHKDDCDFWDGIQIVTP
jgi:para-nitrobenzyl esterase